MIAADGHAMGEIAALFLDSEAWRIQSLNIKLRKEVADQLGATRGMFHAPTLELPVGMEGAGPKLAGHRRVDLQLGISPSFATSSRPAAIRGATHS